MAALSNPMLEEPPVYEYSFACSPTVAAYASEVLAGWPGVLSVMERYTDTQPGSVDTEPTSIVFWTNTREDAQQIVAALAHDQQLAPLVAQVTSQPVFSEDWSESWKQFWSVERITDQLTICPSWENHTPENPVEQVIYLDPGSAFGTGAHPTTRLMMQYLESLPGDQLANGRFLDVGTGSGILTIAAGKLGAKQLVAIDIDSHCVEVAEHNATANHIVAHFEAGQLADMSLGEPFTLIVANILAPVIQELLPAMTNRLSSGGRLALSGLIKSDEQLMCANLAEHYNEVEVTEESGWLCISAVKS